MSEYGLRSDPEVNIRGAKRIWLSVIMLYGLAVISVLGALLPLLSQNFTPILSAIFWASIYYFVAQKLMEGSNSGRKGVLTFMVINILLSTMLIWFGGILLISIGFVLLGASVRIFVAMWGNSDLMQELSARADITYQKRELMRSQ